MDYVSHLYHSDMLFSVALCCLFIEDRMSTKIFVGRLADGTTNDELHGLFRKFGTVTEAVAMGNYGFVVSISSLRNISKYIIII